MLGYRTVKSPNATMMLALTTASGEFSNKVNKTRKYFSQTLELRERERERDNYCTLSSLLPH